MYHPRMQTSSVLAPPSPLSWSGAAKPGHSLTSVPAPDGVHPTRQRAAHARSQGPWLRKRAAGCHYKRRRGGRARAARRRLDRRRRNWSTV